MIVRMQYNKLLEAVTNTGITTDSAMLKAALNDDVELTDCPILLVCTQQELAEAIKNFGTNRMVVGYLVVGNIDFEIIEKSMPQDNIRPLNVLLPYTYSSDTDTNLVNALGYLKSKQGMAENVNVLVKLPAEYCNMRYVQDMCKTYSNIRYTGGKLINLIDCRIGAVINDDLYKKIAESKLPLVYTNDDCVSLVCEYTDLLSAEWVLRSSISATMTESTSVASVDLGIVEQVENLEETKPAISTEEKVEKVKKPRKPRTKKVKEPVNTETVAVEETKAVAVAEEVPKAETAVTETVKVEVDTVETVKTEPVVEETPKAEPVVEETPKAESVVEEASKVEPVVEEVPKAEPVVEETPKAEPVVEETTKAEPVVEEVAKVEPIVEEVPKTEPVVEEVPKVEPAVAEVAKVESIMEKTAKTASVEVQTSNADLVIVETPKVVSSKKGTKANKKAEPKVTKQSIIASKFTISDEF